jgi:proline iminopeptidase
MPGQMIDVTGGRVWAEIVGDGPGTPLLVLHGGPGVPSYYLDSLRALASERPVVLYDQLGCGRSDRPADTSLYRAERFVAEVGQVRDALGLGRVHLLGQSWGGMLAAMYVLTAPPGLASLVLASPVIDSGRWADDCARLKAALPAEVQEVIDEHEASGFTGCPEYAAATLEWWRRHICRLRPFPADVERALASMGVECYATMWGPSEFTLTGNLRDVTLSPRLPELALPVLFTCGRHDEATPESTGYFAGLVPGARLAVFEDSSHMAHLEQADAYLAQVSAFLTEADARDMTDG